MAKLSDFSPALLAEFSCEAAIDEARRSTVASQCGRLPNRWGPAPPEEPSQTLLAIRERKRQQRERELQELEQERRARWQAELEAEKKP